MLPIKLTIQAWGAYPDRVEIPFSKLGENGIYLISGVTGSGKTTIFDAMTYALFNQVSGSIRDNSTLRSHFAKEDVETFVELEFLFNGEIYKIKRQPQYERKNLRKEGMVKQNAKAELYFPNSNVVQGISEVNKAIEELIGIDVNQFCQIALLPQGEFMRLLNSDTQTRCEIFRNIFKTNNFSKFSLSLKNKAQEYYKKYDENKNSVLQYISQLKLFDIELQMKIDNILSKKTIEKSLLSDFLDSLQAAIKNDEEKNSLFKKEIDDINDEILSLEKFYQREELKNNLINQKLTFEKQLKIESSAFLAIKKENDLIPEKKLRFEKIKQEIIKAEDENKKCLEIEKLTHEISEINLVLGKYFKNFNENNERVLILANEHLAYLNNKKNILEQKIKDKQAQFTNNQNELRLFEEKYNNLFYKYLSIQAGLIAKNLKDNEPCPVCGSKVHPNLAKVEDETLTKEFIDDNKKLLEDKTKKLAALASEIEGTIKDKKILIDKLKENEENYKVQFAGKIDYFNVETKEKDFENLIKQIVQDNEKIKTQIAEVEVNKKTKENLVENIKKDIRMLDLNLIKIEYENLIKTSKNLENEIEDILNLYNEKNILIEKISTNIKLIEEQISQIKEEKNNETFEELKEKINKKKDECLKRKDEYSIEFARLSQNKEIFKLLLKQIAHYGEIEKTYNQYQILSDVANGNIKGVARVDFEQYIQGYYLDLVLNKANEHFKIMTKNQYQLLRKQEITSKISKTSLDIEVMDFHTFKTRSVKTLSGGESFKAALSLALGLSDCISSMSGIMNIDSMFIDEGFGSLDSESLELAMQVIADLSTTKRLIGIISHVEELKNKIENRIDTIKTEFGSKVKLNF